MGWDHLERTKRDNLAVMVDLMDHDAEPIQFCKVFGLYGEFLAVEVDGLARLSASFDEYLLVLASEELGHVLSPRHKLTSLGGKLSKLEVFRTTSPKNLPPEILLGREMYSPSVVESLHNIVILAGAFDPAPEVKLLELVLMAQLEHAGLQRDDFLGGKRLSNPVGVLEFR